MATKKDLSQYTTKLSKISQKSPDETASSPAYERGEFKIIPIREIKPNPRQPRQVFDPEKLEELTESIRDQGVLQPVIVRIDEKQRVYLVAGERRLRAAKQAGLEEIPAVISQGDPMEVALIENVQRENLGPIEEAEAFTRLMEDHKYTHEKLANILRKDRTTITRILSLNQLPDSIKKECARAHIYPRRLLVEIASLKTSEEMEAVFEKVKHLGLTSDDLRKELKKKRKKPTRTGFEGFCAKIEGLAKNLAETAADDLTPEEKARFIQILSRLNSEVQKLLKAL